MRVALGTKADTLKALAAWVTTCQVGKQYVFTVADWNASADAVIKAIQQSFPDLTLIIRSSAPDEDCFTHSNAGKYASVAHVKSMDKDALIEAITRVIASYQAQRLPASAQLLVEEQIYPVTCSGVILTCMLDTGAPYYQINLDDQSCTTDMVTNGHGKNLRTVIIEKNCTSIDSDILLMITMAKELERLLQHDKLNIEFAVDHAGRVHLFQARAITHTRSEYLNHVCLFHQALQQAAVVFQQKNTYFGNMPDWNPAEIIGIRPRPLALSLYQHLITDDVWAVQRAESGYRDVRPHPLITPFCGQPYVDIRASFTSFIPASLPDPLAMRLVDAYMNILRANPHLHDKVEFDVVLSSWTPTFLTQAQQRFRAYSITPEEITHLENALKEVTRNIIHSLPIHTLPLKDLAKNRIKILEENTSALLKASRLLDDCKTQGSLAFAHAARAAFVAKNFLNSFKASGILSDDEYTLFLNHVQTVAGLFERDCELFRDKRIDMTVLLERYGHLRPGTYDITTAAYWEKPDRYFTTDRKSEPNIKMFALSNHTKARIKAAILPLCLDYTVDEFLAFIENSIAQREYAKFEFTKNVSLALDCIIDYGAAHGLSRDMLSFVNCNDLFCERNKLPDIPSLKLLIEQRKKQYLITQMVQLPTLITCVDDFYYFERQPSEPNYITQHSIEAPRVLLDENLDKTLSGSIVLISHADPGYDWLFNHDIAGLITEYGGANSHMAIRAAEMNLPAAIGVGEKLYEHLIAAKRIQLDCANSIIRIIA